MRVLLFTGKGGVGKTTTAAATAVHAARHGVKTLVLSTDAAHSLGDALGQVLVPGAAREVEPGLFAEQVDVGVRLERSWGSVQAYLVEVLAALDVDPEHASGLTGLPGADDVLTLLALRDHVLEGRWDLVVVDCAPTAETLRLLALPEALTRLVDRLLPLERRVVRSLVPSIGRAAGLPVPRVEVGQALLRLRNELAEAQEVLRAPSTSVRLVLTPESVVLAESRRTLAALSLHGYVVDGVVANRVVPAGDDAWRDSWAQAQLSVLAQADEAFAPVAVVRSPYLSREPVGADALADLAAAVHGPGSVERLLAEPDGVAPIRVEPSGQDFVLVLELGLGRTDAIDLSRRDDELHVSVAGRRRVLPLPSVLRRCIVVNARVRDGALQVRFARDPALWPAS